MTDTNKTPAGTTRKAPENASAKPNVSRRNLLRGLAPERLQLRQRPDVLQQPVREPRDRPEQLRRVWHDLRLERELPVGTVPIIWVAPGLCESSADASDSRRPLRGTAFRSRYLGPNDERAKKARILSFVSRRRALSVRTNVQSSVDASSLSVNITSSSFSRESS